MIKCLLSTLRQRTINGHLEMWLRKIHLEEYNDYRDVRKVRKVSFLKCFPSTLKRGASVFKSIRLEERFENFVFVTDSGSDGKTNLTKEMKLSFPPLNSR